LGGFSFVGIVLTSGSTAGTFCHGSARTFIILEITLIHAAKREKTIAFSRKMQAMLF
jgi:hypothetical protein